MRDPHPHLAGAGLLDLDRDAGLFEQLSWLEQAGFDADCIYKHYFVAVFLALKQVS